MKLIGVSLEQSIVVLGIRTPTARIRLEDPQWRDWRIAIKGASVFLESPPGFRYGGGRDGDVKTRLVAEIPRSQCVLEWEAEDGEVVGESAEKKGGKQ